MRILAPEALVRLRVNETAILEWSCTPVALPTLAAGWLVCEGVVRETDEIRDVTTVPRRSRLCRRSRGRPGAGRVAATVAGPVERTRRSVRPAALASPHDAEGPPSTAALAELRPMLEDRDRVAAWFRDMFDQAALRASVGGVHTGGLVVDGALAFVVEDVSRHHVVDRLVGSAFLAGIPLHEIDSPGERADFGRHGGQGLPGRGRGSRVALRAHGTGGVAWPIRAD